MFAVMYWQSSAKPGVDTPPAIGVGRKLRLVDGSNQTRNVDLWEPVLRWSITTRENPLEHRTRSPSHSARRNDRAQSRPLRRWTFRPRVRAAWRPYSTHSSPGGVRFDAAPLSGDAPLAEPLRIQPAHRKLPAAALDSRTQRAPARAIPLPLDRPVHRIARPCPAPFAAQNPPV